MEWISTTVSGSRSLMRSYSIFPIFCNTALKSPTPVGSTMRYSGSRVLTIVSMEEAKSDFNEQQIQPSVNSQILSRSFCKTAPSIPAPPYSFSITTNFCAVLSERAWMKVVLPAPKKPEITKTFILHIRLPVKNPE